MKKIINLLLICILILPLSSCKSNKPINIDTTNQEEIPSYTYILDATLKEEIGMDIYDVPKNDDISTSPFYIYGDTLYYVLDYIPYYEDPLGEKNLVFNSEHNTQIRSLCLSTGEDQLLYLYQLNTCMDIIEIQCNGNELVWEENTSSEGWKIKKLDLNNKQSVEEIVAYQENVGENYSVPLSITQKGLYWSDGLYKREHPILIYYYDFKTKEKSIEKENVDLSSPYEHISIIDQNLTYYENSGENTVMHIANIISSKQTSLHVLGAVACPISNENMCIWMEGYDANDRCNLFVYNFMNNEFEKIELSYAFSYALVGDYILVNQNEGLYCYDIKDNTYCNLWETAKDEWVAFNFTSLGMENNAFGEVKNANTDVMQVVNFYVK